MYIVDRGHSDRVMFAFVVAPGEKMAEVINRTRKEAKAKISKVC